MSTTAQSVITSAATLLNDTDNTRWPVAELLQWMTDGQREAVTINPDLYTLATVLTLAAGVRQTLAPLTDLNLLMSITRNMAVDGVTPGRVIRVTSPDLLDNFDPDWHSGAQASTIVHFTYDKRTYNVFQVYPPAVVGTKVEAIYSAIPPAIASVEANISLSDLLAPALVDYLCYRALTKDAEFGDSAAKAAAHYGLFKDAVTVTDKSKMDQNPNLEQAPFNPASAPASK